MSGRTRGPGTGERRAFGRAVRLALALLGVLLVLWGSRAPARAQPAKCYVSVRLEGVVNPVKQRAIASAITRAQQDGCALVLLSLDTPGGLVSSMQEIVRDVTNSPVPVVGFVEPRSGQASSAGAFILLATDVAAMAPGTRVGAAHPVGHGEELPDVLDEKATSSLAALAISLAQRRARPVKLAEEMVRSSTSYTAEDAHSQKLIEIIASDRADLLRQLEQRTLDFQGKKLTFTTSGLSETRVEISWVGRLLDVVADPTVASMLLSLGLLGLGYELASPGVGLGGILGSICVLLGLYGLSVLPVEIGGVILIVAGFAAIAVEVKVPSHGLVASGGVLALVLGAMVLVDPSGYFGGLTPVKWQLIVPLVGGAAVMVLLLARLARRAQAAAVQTGPESLVGRQGTAKTGLVAAEGGRFTGVVFVDGARWEAESDTEVRQGQLVEVVSVLRSPMRLRVRSLEKGTA